MYIFITLAKIICSIDLTCVKKQRMKKKKLAMVQKSHLIAVKSIAMLCPSGSLQTS